MLSPAVHPQSGCELAVDGSDNDEHLMPCAFGVQALPVVCIPVKICDALTRESRCRSLKDDSGPRVSYRGGPVCGILLKTSL